MKLIDLSLTRDFEIKCAELKDIAHPPNGSHYDLIVGIATGGEFVVKTMKFPIQDDNIMIVKRQRSNTKNKEGSILLKSFLKIMPNFAKNFLRRLESYILEFKFSLSTTKIEDAEFRVMKQPSAIEYNSILVVDDAVDSGATLKQTIKYLEKRYPNSSIKSACITVTFRNPIIRPDFYLYNRSLVKFPWSLDAR